MSEPILRLEGLRKVWNLGTPLENEVLHGIDPTLERGELTALIGPPGSGKSTLLNLIGLLDTPTAGELWLQGQPTRTWPRAAHGESSWSTGASRRRYKGGRRRSLFHLAR